MRSVYLKTLFLTPPPLLLLLLTVNVAAATFERPNKYCMFDQLMQGHSGQLPLALTQETPAAKNKQSSFQAYAASEKSDDWEPLRIAVSTKDLEDGGRHCNSTMRNKAIVDFEGKQHTCRDTSMLENQKLIGDVKANINTILKKAIKLHADRLYVKRATGYIQLPKFATGICQYFTVPETYRNPGFQDADIVLFVGAVPSASSTATGWAVPCAVNREGRPVAGAINMFPNAIKVSRQTVRSAAHQIGHALGFWHEIMQNLRMTDRRQVRTKRNHVSIVKSKKLRQSARKHYGCDAAHGMELEDGPHNNSTESHWERRNAKDELMANFFSDAVSAPLLGLYTSLTLSAFEDMGFYKAEFSKAEPMRYGAGVGCGLFNESCWNENRTVKFTDMFCEKEGFFSCTTDRRSLGLCMKEKNDNAASQWNFNNLRSMAKVGQKAALTDFCPVVVPFGLTCRNPWTQQIIKTATTDQSSFNDNLWCLDGGNLKVKMIGNTAIDVGGICAEILCDEDKQVVKVKVEGDDVWHVCSANGNITPKTKGTKIASGNIKCPKYEEVCTVGKEGESLVTSKTTAQSK